MTTLGRKLNRWTYSEVTRLHQMHCAGKTRKEIAAELNMTEDRVRSRLQWEEQSTVLGAARKKRRMERRAAERIEMKAPRVHFEVVSSGPKPTEEALRQRDLRYAAMPRDLTGAFFGDPPVGFSALEQRA